MSVAERLQVDRAHLADLCLRRGIDELCVFGSALGEDFHAESDVDLLVTFSPGTQPGLRDLLDMEEEFAALFGRRVDLVERRLVEESPNYIRRRHILGNLERVYGS